MVISSLVAWFGFTKSYLHDSLLPTKTGTLAWELETRVDSSPEGGSTMRSRIQQDKLSFDFSLSNKPDRSAAAAMRFKDTAGKIRHVDLSRYNTISFVIRCAPANTLYMSIATFDKKASKPGDLGSYRPPYTYFSCGEAASRIELDLTRLTVPEWWADTYKIDLGERGYKFDRVAQIEFGASFRAPAGVNSQFEIEEINLNGRDTRYLMVLAAVLLLAWAGYALWFFRAYTRSLQDELQNKIQRDMPLVAYQQLAIEPHRDKEKSAILRVMATRYADPELDLDTVVLETGANRNKVNDILKAELGYTFSTYLNKLRLTEAARLLAEAETATVGEIAYSVGYKNVTYFNRLFKEEYDCTPKAFREVYKKQQ